MILKRVDHLVYSTPDLDASVDDLENRLGIRAVPGGRHPGRGTRNALLAIGERSYLEIVGPDASQPIEHGPRWFGIDDGANPRLTTWAANTTSLDEVIAHAATKGLTLGPIIAGQRTRSDGVLLNWEFTDPVTTIADGLVPFFIDWGRSPHPATTSPSGLRLVALRGEHPQPHSVLDALSRLDIPLHVDYGPAPALIATLETSKGLVELR
jgi:catechol 2,3-dioxygenase-like lactoylglutathione lyase family enzyme